MRRPPQPAPGGDPTRHQSRERALGLLYEAEMKGDAPVTVLEALVVPADEFTTRLVSWTQLHGSRADELVAEASLGWALDRMAVVDRLVLRMAVSELLEPEPAGAPAPVVIDEAVELAKTYSTEDSGGFVNGILSAISARVR